MRLIAFYLHALVLADICFPAFPAHKLFSAAIQEMRITMDGRYLVTVALVCLVLNWPLLM